MAGLSILRVVSNDEIDAEEKRRIRAELEARQSRPVILNMAAYIKKCWEAAKDAKEPIERLMLKAKRQRNGEYEPSKLSSIRNQGGSEVFMRITEVKCRAAESWLRDILLADGGPPWDLRPTPVANLDPSSTELIQSMFAERVMNMIKLMGQSPSREDMENVKETLVNEYKLKVQQQAQNRADRMKHRIEDQFAEGGWYQAFDDFITDLVTYPAAFIKGPMVRRRTVLKWKRDTSGYTYVEPEETLIPEFERVDPFRIYPEPGVTNINDGYLFQHHPMPRSELAGLIGVPGYDEDAIRQILESESIQTWFDDLVEDQKEDLERKFGTYRSPNTTYDVLEFWGKISGKHLIEWGLTSEEVPDPAREYDGNVWIVGNYVIKAVLNADPLGEKPYAKTSFIKVPGAFWGMGIPEMIEDIQNVCNACARALVNNMGIASGPQVEINLDRVPPNEDITEMYPWKIWQVNNDPLGSAAPAVRFSQPDDRSTTLMGVYERFARMADEHSGIPSYVSGDISVTGAGRTSSGLSMLMGAAGKGIRQVVGYIDSDVIKPVVERQFVFNMRFDEDETIKGDSVIVPRGASTLAVKEVVNVRRIEFLNATANPIDAQIMGVEGRGALLREVAKTLQMPSDDIVPSREKQAIMAMAQAQMPQAQPGAPGETLPDGSPAGGQAANVVANQQTGRTT
jgi:hypothetical protein